MQVELRDYFAAKAMAALITETGLMLDDFTDQAYEIADKMLESRDKRRERSQAETSQARVHGVPPYLWYQPWRGGTPSSQKRNGLG